MAVVSPNPNSEPRMFVRGAQDRHLSDLGHLPKIGVQVTEILFSVAICDLQHLINR